MKTGIRLIGSCILLIILDACAFDLVHVEKLDRTIETQNPAIKEFQLDKEITVKLNSGYSRTLQKDTTWSYVGTISEGDVFQTNDQILTVEASNIYEAYIVVSSGTLLGFYLPVERAYSPLDKPEDISLTKTVSKP